MLFQLLCNFLNRCFNNISTFTVGLIIQKLFNLKREFNLINILQLKKENPPPVAFAQRYPPQVMVRPNNNVLFVLQISYLMTNSTHTCTETEFIIDEQFSRLRDNTQIYICYGSKKPL